MKIYTKTGDEGQTGLFGGGRVPKHDERVATYGDIDELNSVLGVARSGMEPGELADVVESLQRSLFTLGAELATQPERIDRLSVRLIDEDDVTRLEGLIDRLEKELSTLKSFILPGGAQAAATLHLARSVCRRAERHLVALAENSAVRSVVLRFVNRLSDLLFVLARAANQRSGVDDLPWDSAAS